MKYGLSERTLNTLNSIFKQYPKTNEGFTHRNLLRLIDDFEDSDMPYFVDVSVYGDISNSDLKARIDRLGVILYTGE